MILRGETSPAGQDDSPIVRRILIIAVVFVITMCGVWAAPTIQASKQLQPKQQVALPANKIQPVRVQDDLHINNVDALQKKDYEYKQDQWKFYVMVESQTTFCGGGVLSPSLVVTAGHCCVDDGTAISVYYGPFDQGRSEARKKSCMPVLYNAGDLDPEDPDPDAEKYAYPHKDEQIMGDGPDAKQWSPINDVCIILCDKGVSDDYMKMDRKDFPKLGTLADMPDEFYFGGSGMPIPDGLTGTFRWAKLPRGDCIENKAFDKKENKEDLIARYPVADGAFQEVICTVGPTFPCSGDSGSPLWNADKTKIYGVLVDIKWRTCTEGPAWFTNLTPGRYATWVDYWVEQLDPAPETL